MDEPTHVEITEAALLGAAILSPAALAGMVDEITADDWSRESHRAVYVTLAEMKEAGTPVDQITLSDALVESGRIDVAGGLSAPFDLAALETCPTPSAWPVYSGIVRREAERRRTIARLRRELERLEAGANPEVAA